MFYTLHLFIPCVILRRKTLLVNVGKKAENSICELLRDKDSMPYTFIFPSWEGVRGG
jgi:hypothetical protein